MGESFWSTSRNLLDGVKERGGERGGILLCSGLISCWNIKIATPKYNILELVFVLFCPFSDGKNWAGIRYLYNKYDSSAFGLCLVKYLPIFPQLGRTFAAPLTGRPFGTKRPFSQIRLGFPVSQSGWALF